MKIARTIVQVALIAAFTAFIAINLTPVNVRIWPLSDTFLIVETPVGIVALIAFLLGLVPMWLLHRASKWNNERRIASLESAARAAAMAPPPPQDDPSPMQEPPPVP